MSPPASVALQEHSDDRQESAAELFRRIRSRLRSLLSRFHIPPRDAQDLLQETFVYYLLQPDRARHPEAWIIGTLRNRCRHYWHRRRTSTLTFHPVDPDRLIDLAGGHPDSADARVAVLSVREAFQHLSSRDRHIIHLRFVLECSGDEIGHLLDISPATARKTALRALDRLRRLFADSRDRSPNVS